MIIRYFAGVEGTAKDVMAEFKVVDVRMEGEDLAVEFKPVPGWDRKEDLIPLEEVGWIPLRWLWPAAWLALIILSLATAVQQYVAGNYLNMTAPGAMFFLLFVWALGVVQRALYGSLYHPAGIIQPETAEEAAIFAGCRTLTLAEYASAWVQQFKVFKPFRGRDPEPEPEEAAKH